MFLGTKTKLKMFQIVYKCECVFFRMRNFTSHTMKSEEQFLQGMKLKRGILSANMRVNFAHTKQWSKGIKNMKSVGWGVIF